MLLSKVLKNIAKIATALDCEILGLSADSRQIKDKYLFAAYPGDKQDGRNFIAQAINEGAIAIIYDPEGFTPTNKKIPHIPVATLRLQISKIAANFYHHPSQHMTMIGITGTNGKTSCSHFIANALQTNNIPCGIIGTLGAGFPENLTPNSYTTPEPIMLQKILHDLHQNYAQAIAMEVSSHALEQGRVTGINYPIAVFTNLSRDHLDYHETMEKYFASKKALFTQSSLMYAVINADDEYGKQLIDTISPKVTTIAYSISDTIVNAPTIRAKELTLSKHGFQAKVETPWGNGELNSTLLGRFNISNLLAVLGVLGIMNIPLPATLASLAKLTNVMGRMQTFGGNKKPLVVVDFAHTPDALEKTLKVLREHCEGSLWCVFGCGGDRDRGKRPIMGQIAEQLSDYLIITDDNPRTEDPQQIINDILPGLLCPWAVEIEHDRSTAITNAITSAKENDIVLIAGKGHEPYQIIGKEKIPYSDIELVKTLT